MARIRTIKPEFFTSLTVASLSLTARLTFVGLWTQVDDEGRCVDDVRLIRAALWALDDRSFAEIENDLKELDEASLIQRYEVAGRSYLAVPSLLEHQRINRPSKSKLPSPPRRTPPTTGGSTSKNHAFSEDSVSTHGAFSEAHGGLTEDSPQERKGKERKGSSGTGAYLANGGSARDLEEPPNNEPAGPAEKIITDWCGSLARPPQRRIVEQIGTHVVAALRDGCEPADVSDALRVWQQRGSLGPSVLPSLIHEITNRPPSGSEVVPFRGRASVKPSTTDERVGQALALSAKYEQLEAQEASQ